MAAIDEEPHHVQSVCPERTSLRSTGTVNLRIDNDMFGGVGQDQGYSNGFLVSRVSPNLVDYRSDPCLAGIVQTLNRRLALLQPEGFDEQNMTVGLGQMMCTPTDRGRRGDTLRTSQLRLGVVGPAAHAGEVQNEWHRLLGNDRFLGWDNQLYNEPVVRLIHERRTRVMRRESATGRGWDLTRHWGKCRSTARSPSAGASRRQDMRVPMNRLILPLPGNEALAAALAEACDGELGGIETRRFPDGESYVGLNGDPRGRPVNLVCTLGRPDAQFLSLVFAVDAARDLGAFDKIITIDPHLHPQPTLRGLYTVSTVTMQAAPLLADWIATHVESPFIIGPDEESEQWAGAIARRIDAPHAVLAKTRYGDRNVEIIVPDLSAWRHCTPVLVDDIASSGRTLTVAARKLVEQGLCKPECVVVHALFADDAWNELTPLFSRIVSTDAVPDRSNRIALADLIADAAKRKLQD